MDRVALEMQALAASGVGLQGYIRFDKPKGNRIAPLLEVGDLMPITTNSLQQFAVQEANELKAAEARIEQEIQQTAEIIAALIARRDSARLSHQRLLNYTPALGSDYQCPRCWVHHEARSVLTPVPGTDNEGFRCDVCGFHLGISGL